MSVEISLDTPLAKALGDAVQTKLMDTGWANGGLDDSALGEYIILMLVNGKTQDQIASELATDLLSLPPEDTGAAEFSRWLFEQVAALNQGLIEPQQNQVAGDDPNTISIRGAASRLSSDTGVGDTEMSEVPDGGQDSSIPTGPKALRNPPRAPAGSRRMVGQVNKAMDRSGEGALHRVRSQQGRDRINTHNRPPPKGPRNEQGKTNRLYPGQGQGVANGAANGNTASTIMQMGPQQQMQLMAMLEQQAQMMAQMQQMSGMVNQPFQNGRQTSSKSLFDRVDGPPRKSNGHQARANGSGVGNARNHNQHIEGFQNGAHAELPSSMETESSQPTEVSPDTLCKFNLKCTKKDCVFAHQSPAAPPGITVDVHDVCPFAAACKNKKCVGRHPSPFQKVAHASEQDCKFFPNCTNPSCPFRHPTMPVCRNGADCNREGCKFTHVRIMCKYNPCLNPDCVYKHAEGQKRGKYGDKVWTANQAGEHVSERKFIVDEDMGAEELVRGEPQIEDQGHGGSQHSAEVVT